MSVYPKASAAAAQDAATTHSVRFPELEERILAYWDEDGTFQASVDGRDAGRDGANEFVFYDGPPFANGLPHYGHLLTGYAKDLVARYQTLRGKRVERRFGWDTHGLPAELEAMKQLGMNQKSDIDAMGVDKFNDACRASVLKYTREWEAYVKRQARWVDFENDYKTLNVEYMESVIWAFKTLHEKGLTYSGYRVLPYCWNDETPLSNHELRMDDDVYKDRQDQTVTVTFPLLAGDSDVSRQLAGVLAIAWTTTPWTLPTNAALAVGPEVRYAVVPAGPDGVSAPGVSPFAAGTRFLLAEDLVASYAKDLGYEDAQAAAAAVERTYLGTELEGIRYEPLWDYFADAEVYGTGKAWRILVADYVTTTDGTGIVHQAPAYGEDDQRVCEAAGIPVILSVDDGAKFLPLFGSRENAPLREIVGLQVFEANKPITRVLREQGRLLKQASYVHSYPHCWRCRNPLIYRAVSSWFVEVTKIKDRMLELNEQITWIPGNVKHGQFGKWLENARDWSISRNRYWGSPIPVWVSDNPEYPRTDVYGSLAELEADFGRLPLNHEGKPDLHRPFIDELSRPNPDDPTGRSTMRRVPDVLDVWFDSGSMPYAQVHYPYENQEWFETHNPGDFIVEYIGQTRGWFYTLHILATALFDRPAFRNVISHGIVLGSDGQKMSKSLRNYPDVSEVLDRDGSDAMRWFLMASPILRGGNLIVTEQGIRDGVRQVILPLWNVYSFFTLYANAARASRDGAAGAGFEAAVRHDGYTDPLDRYLMAQTGRLVRGMQQHLDAYDISTACDVLREYLDMLTNWYVRRSRQRFFDEDADAFDALFTALEAVCRVAAPLLPLVTEEIWRGLTGGRSVHLTDWPDAALFADDPALVEQMDRTQAVCSAGSSLRKAAKLRVRLPLAAMTVVVPGAAELSGSEAVIADELNLKAVRLLDAADASEEEFGIERRLVVNARAAGPRLGKGVQTAIKGSKSGDWSVADDGSVTAGGIGLEPHEYTLETVVDPAKAGEHAAVAMLPGGGFVVLDTGLTPELEAEGLARDLVRVIQQARKEADLAVGDRIRASVTAKAHVIAAAREHAELLRGETLAVELELLVADVEPSALVERVDAGVADGQGVRAGEAGQ
ncbi:isoleucyl-tRNA synthase [Sinomonas atrocyanea]|uniref:Isoleucine--tRNA ligase n=1 Tax=Sinomonas atrocyanea TaxID=37927 RepID=A0A127A5U6_9MICC|nr:isoleucine--tRNA ligase [Sinomonas atrocyanea]AMM33002.1 isoleucyl-tRNA synthase [Sinomonas atrocyanea]GEB64310.1 isoleucine--tRNA ligase [Sinomonas atrocyanea]GGG73668.1 isoleucine--tRNA ligase [Sinomonas atrocyanea]